MPNLRWIPAIAAGIMAANLSASPTVLHGSVIDAADLSSMKVGVYQFDSESYRFTPLITSPNFYAKGGVILTADHKYFPITVDDDWYDFFGEAYYTIFEYDSTDWSPNGQATPDDSSHNTTTAVDPATGTTYGCFKQNYEATTWYFGTYSIDDLASSRIADLDSPWLACDFAADGTLYAIDRNGTLSTVNTSDGAMTTVAQTGITASAIGSGAIDRASGIFYVANSENLYAVNLASKETSIVYKLENSQQIVGMYVAQEASLASLPSKVTGLGATVSSSSCTVTFTMPETDDNGAPLSGSLTYTITDNGTVATEGEANAGEDVSHTITLQGSGIHTIGVKASLNGANGPEETVDVTVDGKPDYALDPPYVQTFDNEDAFNTMVVNDANNDGWKWIYWNNSAYSQFSGTEPADDYLLTPMIWLEAGKCYRFTCDFWQRETPYDEIVEIVYGTSQDPGCLTSVASFHLTDGQRHQGSAIINITETGVYHVGLHVVSPKNKYGIYADNFELSAGISPNAPAAQQLVVRPASDGALSASLSINPTFNTQAGLECEISSISLYRSDKLVKTFDNIVPGESLSFTDAVDTAGVYQWSAVAANRYGNGFESKASAFVGINVPGAPTSFTACETGTWGEVEFNWEAPVVDKDGNAFEPSLARYMLVYRLPSGGIRIIADDIQATSYTATVKQPVDEQEFLSFAVFAKSDAGTNDWNVASTPVMPIGRPYVMPYTEPFGALNSTYTTTTSNQSSKWEILSTSADHDGNGKFLFFNCYRGHSGSITTGKINVTGTSPVLTFWYMCLPGASDVIDVAISENGTEFIPVTSVGVGDGYEQTWQNASVRLKDFVGKTVRVRLSYTCAEYNLGIDDLSITDLTGYDLCASAISVPHHAVPGTDTPIKVAVENKGSEIADVFYIDLYRNGELLSSRIEQNLEPFATEWYTFYDILNVFDTENTYYASVTLEGDSNPANDRTAEATLGIELTDLPAPQSLVANENPDGSVEIRCSEPALDLTPVFTQDGIEDYEPFSIGLPTTQTPNDNIGDWSMIDGDGMPCAIIQQNDEYAIFPNANKPMSFIVFDVKSSGLSEKYHYKFIGHNSDKCFMAITGINQPNDDWLISPMLSGNAQTVKFFAKSAVDSYGLESFEVHTSDSNKKRDSFTLVKEYTDVPTDWTEYTIEIPEGTKYFAIHYNAMARYAFLLDDFTFEAASRDSQLSFKGYKIYRNEKLIATLTSGNTFTDTDWTKGDAYHATALYAEGESKPTAKAIATSLNDLSANSAITVSVEGSTLHITNPAGHAIAVYDALGRTVSGQSTERQQSIEVAPGIYMVTDGTTTVKAIAR